MWAEILEERNDLSFIFSTITHLCTFTKVHSTLADWMPVKWILDHRFHRWHKGQCEPLKVPARVQTLMHSNRLQTNASEKDLKIGPLNKISCILTAGKKVALHNIVVLALHSLVQTIPMLFNCQPKHCYSFIQEKISWNHHQADHFDSVNTIKPV